MKILVNDFSGFAYPVQLSRELALRGYTVLHTWCSSFVSPHGPLGHRGNDPREFEIRPIELDRTFNKQGLLSRWKDERAVGRRMVVAAQEFQPDIILSANMPLGAQGLLLKYARKHHVPFLFWIQDLYGVGATAMLRKRIPVVGGLIGHAFGRYEQTLLANSTHVVAITEDFVPYLPKNLARKRISVIENWAPVDELPILAKSNEWSRTQGLADKFCFLYAGTLGMKHNPDLLLELAGAFRKDERVRVVIISEGAGAAYLARRKVELRLDNLLLLGFQPFDVMPQMLASADVLLTILEPDAGKFAVPSKVLTYLSACRPLLLAVPAVNLAARIVSDNRAGLVVPPDDLPAFVEAAERLVKDVALRSQCADNGRAYAERTFDIGRIADRFEQIIRVAAEAAKVKN